MPNFAMQSTMMPIPLTISYILQRAEGYAAQQEVVSMLPVGLDPQGRPIPGIHRYTYAQMAQRAKQLALALQSVGIRKGDAVATLGSNHYRHLEAYFGIPIVGAVLHTVNVRLAPEHIVYILNHAQDRVLLIENSFARYIPQLLQFCPHLEHIIVMGPVPPMGPKVHDYDSWIAAHNSQDFEYVALDENDAAGLCYTSGTTGNPKGVVYSHRSTVLHSLVSVLPDCLCLSQNDTILPIVPMFHVNAWGLPYTAALLGAKQVYTSIFNDGKSVATLLQNEKVTRTAGVPTVWLGLLQELERAQEAGTPYNLSHLERMLAGGSAAPEGMFRAFQRFGLQLYHAWGMTETSPLGTCVVLPKDLDWRSEEAITLRARQGRPVPFVEILVVDDALQTVPADGLSMGRLLVRGPWVTQGYVGDAAASQAAIHRINGLDWFDTGDIVSWDAHGIVIQDRAKDLIKSGGEWISSIALENALMSHPQVLEAAVIAAQHAKWDERPLALVVAHTQPEGTPALQPEVLHAYLATLFPKWCLPDDYIFLPELPHTAAGKVLKRELRDRFTQHLMPKSE